MKVIFLDIDGVLNSIYYVRESNRSGVVIDPTKVELLKRIVDATGAKIVLSSSWKTHWEHDDSQCDECGDEINTALGQFGLEVFDKTPRGYSRESEIEQWLVTMSEYEAIESFVVIDDMLLSADFMDDSFVHTEGISRALDEYDAELAISILNNIK